VQHNNNSQEQTALPTVQFNWDMWWQNYGLAFVAGLSWLLVGMVLLITAQEWTGAVESITLLPLAMLFLLYSHWGNVRQAYQADIVFQLLWVPSFALLGAAFIHLSLAYRPEVISTPRRPRLTIDGLPYLPLIALVAFEWSSFVLFGKVAGRPNIIIALGYGAFGGVLSFGIGIISLLRVSRILPATHGVHIPDNVRRRLGDLLTLWIGGVGLGFCFGILPILLTGHILLPLQIFFALATAYPLLLLYAIRSLRLIDRLHTTLEQREQALREQQKTAETLRQTNTELQQATSLLLHADAHLRSVLSQRIHDQPKQQALRIRSLLGHWQHKLKVEAERDPSGKVAVQPINEALGKVRKISEELESDLRGLQLLVEDAYQRRSLGLKLHLEKLVREDLPALHPESPLKVQPDLWALDALSHDLEQTEEGAKIAEAISYTVTQALLNVYNHAGATFATVQTVRKNGYIEVYITDDGRGFDTSSISPEKTSLFKAQLKAREAGGVLAIRSALRPQIEHGTTIILHLPIPHSEQPHKIEALPESEVHGM
jgi:NarL family two-component system sensor histidine kinase LiaS